MDILLHWYGRHMHSMFPNTHMHVHVYMYNYAQHWSEFGCSVMCSITWVHIIHVHGVTVYLAYLWASPKLVNATLALCCISYTPTLQNTCPKSGECEWANVYTHNIMCACAIERGRITPPTTPVLKARHQSGSAFCCRFAWAGSGMVSP